MFIDNLRKVHCNTFIDDLKLQCAVRFVPLPEINKFLSEASGKVFINCLRRNYFYPYSLCFVSIRTSKQIYNAFWPKTTRTPRIK